MDLPRPASAKASESTSPSRMIRRRELRELVPLADTTIYELEQRGEFPKRFHLTPRCVVWSLAEVEAWIVARKRADAEALRPPPGPDVGLRRYRPVRAPPR